MNTRKQLLFFSALLITTSSYPVGSVVTVEIPSSNISDAVFPSLTGRPRKTAVYLPTGYNPADTLTRYPVLYILHPWSFDYTTLSLYYKPILDLLIDGSFASPMIAVTPDVSYFPYLFGFYTDFTLGGYPMNFETYITDDIVPYIDANFNTDTTTVKKRAISGYEWGGYGAVKIGTKHSDLFGSFSSFLGELNQQQILDAILGFFVLQIPLLQFTTPVSYTNPTYITASQHQLFSPFNQDICANDYLINLMWFFGASAAWSPSLIDPTNPGALPTLNPLAVSTGSGLFTIPSGLTSPNANMSVNLPYDGETNFISTVTVAWNDQRIYEITLNYTMTLTTQNIWLGSMNATVDPFDLVNFIITLIFIDQPSTALYDAQLTSFGIPHTYTVYSGGGLPLWLPSPFFGGVIFPSAYPTPLSDQILFHDSVF